jgi:esterase
MSHGLYFQTHGDRASPLPALVLIHGLFGNSDNLSVIRRHFENDRYVVSIDLPDHGKSQRSETFSFDAAVQKIVALLEELNIPKYVLVGHSLGGKMSMLVAHQRPELISQLVVMDIAPIPYPARHHAVFNGLNSIDLASLNSRNEAKQALSEHLEDPGTQAFLLKSLYQDENGNWAWRFNLPLIVRDYDALSDWQHIPECFNGPTLFIKGAESDYIQSAHQSVIMEQFPQASAKVVQAGHWLHAQKPQVVNALITKFLRVE